MDQYDNHEIYCRKLGHHLYFSYCRKENIGEPCSKIMSCWSQRIDISGFLKNHHADFLKSQDEMSQKPKIASIIDIINQVKSNHSAK
jgi:hypothetical protein